MVHEELFPSVVLIYFCKWNKFIIIPSLLILVWLPLGYPSADAARFYNNIPIYQTFYKIVITLSWAIYAKHSVMEAL